MQRVYSGNNGSARRAFSSAAYVAAGKTGTAQSFYYDAAQRKSFQTVNLTHIGFAPFDNPEIAYAIVVPWASEAAVYESNYTSALAREVVDKYFEIQKKNDVLKESESSSTPIIKPAFTSDKIDEEENE